MVRSIIRIVDDRGKDKTRPYMPQGTNYATVRVHYHPIQTYSPPPLVPTRCTTSSPNGGIAENRM